MKLLLYFAYGMHWVPWQPMKNNVLLILQMTETMAIMLKVKVEHLHCPLRGCWQVSCVLFQGLMRCYSSISQSFKSAASNQSPWLYQLTSTTSIQVWMFLTLDGVWAASSSGSIAGSSNLIVQCVWTDSRCLTMLYGTLFSPEVSLYLFKENRKILYS